MVISSIYCDPSASCGIHEFIFYELLLRSISFVVEEICKGLLKRMKDVFKKLKVLRRKRNSCTSQINNDILETF